MSKLIIVFVTTLMSIQLLQVANLVKNRKKETEFYLFRNNFPHDSVLVALISFVKTPGKFISDGFKKILVFKADEMGLKFSLFYVEIYGVLQGYRP